MITCINFSCLQTHIQVDGVCYDLSYDIETIQHMFQVKQFSIINEKLLQAVKLKAQLDTIETNKPARENTDDTVKHLATSVTDLHTSNSVNHDELKPKSFD